MTNLISPDERRTIWIVDDSPTDAERAQRLLANKHFVQVIHDGAEALERLSQGLRPDLLLLDWVMPGVSGIEVCKYLKSGSGDLAKIPIILLTARYGPAEIAEAYDSGANDYVSKPFIDNELRARVESLLQSKRLLQRAEEAEADVRSLLSNAPDPIFAIDAQGKVKFINEEGLRIFKKPREEIIGSGFDSLVPDMSVRNLTVAAGESYLPIPDVQIGKRIFSPSIRVLPSDSAASTTVVLRDVTERRQADNRRLDFYSVVAHDLRTPITAILLRLEMAFRGIHGLLPAAHLDDLRKTEISLRSLLGLINDFLDLARFEGVGYKVDLKPLNLGHLALSTMEDFKPLIEKNDLSWSQTGLNTDVMVMGDSQRLAQVLSNLIGNAIKFTPSGGKISISLSTTPEHVEFLIEDTGKGIPKNELPTLFDRYTRALDADRTSEGTGLGLMIVREIIEAHGGKIGVESQVGQGSKFWFRLKRNLK